MQLQYLISFKETNLFINVEEKGSRRILYWDTLASATARDDRDVLLFLRKMLTRFSRNLDTLAFRHIEIFPQDMEGAMALLSKTGRVFFCGFPLVCDWTIEASVHWEGDDADRVCAHLQYRQEKIPLESCEQLFPTWCIYNKRAFPIRSSIPWRWVELFRKGTVRLDGVRKKRFLEENPPICWKATIPSLVLNDASGSFATLGRDNPEWEKDLLEVGYLRKDVGNSRYFIPGDRAYDALLLLLEVGWDIFLSDGKKLYRQTGSKWKVSEEKGKIAIRPETFFGEKKTVLKPLTPGKLWIEIDGSSVGLIDRKKGGIFEGEWIGDVLYLPKEQASLCFPLLEDPETEWDRSFLEVVRGLKDEKGRGTAFPDHSFHGELLPHQQKGVDWLNFLYNQGFSCLLADEMGLGKTVQVLAFFSRIKTNLPILIVAPSSLLFHWRSEIRRFLPEAKVAVHTGADRTDVNFSYQYVVTSYALLRIDEKRLTQIQWEAIVLDESSAIKTSTTQTAQAAYRLNGRFKIALNGTPIENRPEEVESQFRFLMPKFIRNTDADARYKRLKPFMLRRKKDELDLPEKMEQIVWIEMDEDQSKLYAAHEEGIRHGLLKKIAMDGTSMHRMEILEAILRLRQLAADPRLVGGEIRGSKVEKVLSDIEEALSENRKILIYSQFTSMLSLIKKELRSPFLYLDGSVPPAERADRVRRFQEDPKVPLFLLSLKAGGVGLNLTAADYVFLFDPWWNEAVENQAIDRAHRIGRKNTVIAKRYLVVGSIEEKMLQIKTEKSKCAREFLDGDEKFNWTEEDLLLLLS